MIGHDREPMVVAMAPYLPEDMLWVDRLTELALPAATEALAPLDPFEVRVQAIIGVPPKRPGIPDKLEDIVRERLSEQLGSRLTSVETIATGHAAGLIAIECAFGQIQSGKAEFALIGGIDSYLDVDTLEWLEEREQIHSNSNAWGFVPGEAAGFCLLASGSTATAYGLRPLVTVTATASAHEKNSIKAQTVCIGEGLSQAIRSVLDSLLVEEKIDQTICDMNGETYRAEEYGFAVARTSERFVDATDFIAPADCWGDVGAASGPLFLSLATVASQKKYARGPRTLAWASSESGERSATIVASTEKSSVRLWR
jgi:3-oxoacyl-[acyl-carrier-protein] synthase-1